MMKQSCSDFSVALRLTVRAVLAGGGAYLLTALLIRLLSKGVAVWLAPEAVLLMVGMLSYLLFVVVYLSLFLSPWRRGHICTSGVILLCLFVSVLGLP